MRGQIRRSATTVHDETARTESCASLPVVRLRNFSLDLALPGNNPNSVLFRTDASGVRMLSIALPVSTPLWLVPTAIFARALDALCQEKSDMHMTRDQGVPSSSAIAHLRTSAPA